MATKIKYENSPPPSDMEFEEISPTSSSSRVQEFLVQGFLSVDFNLIHPRLLGIEREEDRPTNKNTTENEFFENTRKALTGKECASKKTCKKSAYHKKRVLKRILPVESDESDVNSTGVKKPRHGSISKSYLNKSKTILKDSDRKRAKLQTYSKYKKGISAYDIYRCMDSKSYKGLDYYSRKSRRSRSISSDEISFLYRRQVSPCSRLKSPEIRVKREIFSSDDDIYYLGRGKRNSTNDEDSRGRSRRRKQIHTSSSRRSLPRSPEIRVKQEVFSSDDQISYIGANKISENVEDSRRHSPIRIPIQTIKSEPVDCKDSKELYGPNAYYCPLCKISLSSELTWQSHLLGQRHAKAIRAQSVHEVARSSLSNNTFVPVLGEGNRHDKPPPLKKRVELRKEVSSIQEVCNDYQHRHPIMGLRHVWEIRGETETTYYCNLCDAPCGPSSVMPHLIGFKHKLQSLKEYFPQLYDRHKDDHKKQVEKIVKDKFYECERTFKREKIRVFKDVPTTRHSFRSAAGSPEHQPGPSWKTAPSQTKDETMIIRDENGKAVVPSNQEFLDTQYADFHCTLCDSHMNNLSMWEAHIRGKRHLKNEKKAPEGIAATNKYVRAPPGTVSNLVKQIEEVCVSGEIIVGLKYIRENQGKQGNQYNCFPCGGCCSDLDIVDHILGMKHKIKYLEKMEVDGFKNSIMEINNIQVSNYYREQLVDAECQEMMRKYGRGKPKIYYIKRDLVTY